MAIFFFCYFFYFFLINAQFLLLRDYVKNERSQVEAETGPGQAEEVRFVIVVIVLLATGSHGGQERNFNGKIIV